MYRDILGFSITPYMQRVMSANGFYASIMRTGKKSNKSNNKTPPGIPIPVLCVDHLKIKPDNWISGSYVVPVDSDWGLWFNFTMNNPSNTAILVSVKGMNPITGQRVGSYALEEYTEKCPIHNINFSKGKLCSKCGFKWPDQNYIAKPMFGWLDGFRTPDGNVRQFYFTEEMAKSIPELVIGKEDTVPAFGFCFYELKEFNVTYEEGKYVKDQFPQNMFYGSLCGSMIPDVMDSHMVHYESIGGGYGGGRGYGGGYIAQGVYTAGLSVPPKDSDHVRYVNNSGGTSISASASAPSALNFTATSSYGDTIISDSGTKGGKGLHGPKGVPGMSGSIVPDSVSDTMENTVMYRKDSLRKSAVIKEYRTSAEVGIGAGAKIKQAFDKTLKSVKDWRDKPAGVVRLYFVFQEEFEKYASAGFNSLKGNETGYLEGLPVGGSHE